MTSPASSATNSPRLSDSGDFRVELDNKIDDGLRDGHVTQEVHDWLSSNDWSTKQLDRVHTAQETYAVDDYIDEAEAINFKILQQAVRKRCMDVFQRVPKNTITQKSEEALLAMLQDRISIYQTMVENLKGS